MRIEPSPHALPVQKPTESHSWNAFFEHFSTPPSEQQKQAILKLFVHYLAHQIYQQTQHMINIYKKMRDS